MVNDMQFEARPPGFVVWLHLLEADAFQQIKFSKTQFSCLCDTDNYAIYFPLLL